MAKRIGTTREMWKKVRNLDHKAFDNWLIKYWQDAHAAALEQARKDKQTVVKPADIEKAISQVKGVGDIKLRAIMQQVYKLYEEAEESE